MSLTAHLLYASPDASELRQINVHALNIDTCLVDEAGSKSLPVRVHCFCLILLTFFEPINVSLINRLHDVYL